MSANISIRNIPLNGKRPNVNMRELTFDYSGTVVFFSYKTPVAAKVPNSNGFTYLRTNKNYSITTTKHINSWLRRQSDVNDTNVNYVDQAVINGLVPQGVKVG